MEDQEKYPALGIDYGEARVGVALTDPLGILAHPVESIPVQKIDPISRISELARLNAVKTLVLGLPLRLDGEEGTAAAKVRRFGERLREVLPDVPLVFVDEFMTTVVASEKLRAAGRKAVHQRSVIDQAAAVEILNNWMNISVFPDEI